MDHPNYDGLVWFVDEVLPLIERALRWETRLTVAGYIAPHVTLARFQDHPRVTLRGPAADFRPLGTIGSGGLLSGVRCLCVTPDGANDT